MKQYKYFVLPMLPLLMIAFTTQAEVTLNGFASIRATAEDSDGGTQSFNIFAGNGDISFKDESLFAIQARADLGEGLSAAVQLMAEGSNDFEVEARWAYLSYQLNDSHRLSAGRFANPIFFQSEYEKVGYVHNFARLPKAVYIGFDFSTIEGIAVDSSFFLGDYSLDTKVLYGRWNGTAFFSVTGREESFGLNDVMSLRATLSGDWWKVFAGGFVTTLDGGSIDSVVLPAFAKPGVDAALGLGATQADVNNFYDALLWTDKDGEYWYTGFNIDYNHWILDYEYAHYGLKDSSNSFKAVWYGALGYRFDKMVLTVHTEEYRSEIDYDFLDKVQHPILFGTGKAIYDALAQREFDGSGITLRYDFHDSAALKIDYFNGDDTRPDVQGYSIWSIGVDLVF